MFTVQQTTYHATGEHPACVGARRWEWVFVYAYQNYLEVAKFLNISWTSCFNSWLTRYLVKFLESPLLLLRNSELFTKHIILHKQTLCS